MSRLILVLAALLLCAAATPAPLGKIVEWDPSKQGPRERYTAGGLTVDLSLAKVKGEDAAAPVLIVSGAKLGQAQTKGVPGSDTPLTHFLVARLDPKAAGPVVILLSYSYGAHCCTRLDTLDPVGGAWTHVKGGQWDGDGLTASPRDVDGDGVPDFVMTDNEFYYAFGCYACTPAPPQVFNLVGGEWRNVSTAARYRPLFQTAADKLRPLCGEPEKESGVTNGPCAAYVAAAARAGDFDAAWRFMLSHYDHQSQDWPNGCRAARREGRCPKELEIVYKTYSEALRAFLVKHGYITPAEGAAAPLSRP